MAHQAGVQIGIHIPKLYFMSKSKENKSKTKTKPDSGKGQIFYRVVEHLFNPTLPMHGNSLERYDSRIVSAKIRNQVEAQALVEKLQIEARQRKLSHQLRYEVERYTNSTKK